MITGANTNVRYRGILFHVQTEDSGRANPHIISHVYHGGTILGTHKTDYSDRLDADDLTGVVRGLIDQQHASMLEKLHAGAFDDAIAARLGDTAAEAGIEAAHARESKPDTEPDEVEPERGPDATHTVERRGAAPSRPSALPPPKARRAERGFGEGIGSQKPLDEVILEYLAEKARNGGAARKTRSSG